MSSTTKAGLISLVTFLAASAAGYVASHMAALGIPAEYAPIITGALTLLAHWLPTPTQLSTSSQK